MGDQDRRKQGAREPLALKVVYPDAGELVADYTTNISRGGTFILTRRQLAVGALVNGSSPGDVLGFERRVLCQGFDQHPQSLTEVVGPEVAETGLACRFPQQLVFVKEELSHEALP